MSESLEYRMAPAAQKAARILGGLMCVLILTIPVGIWFFLVAKNACVKIGVDMLVAKRFGTARVALSDVKRLGVLQVRLAGGGIGGNLARKLCGGPVATNVCFQLASGKTKTYMASSFERPLEQIDNLAAALGLEVEEVSQGLRGPKWPKSAAA